jgi:hypothetical protein
MMKYSVFFLLISILTTSYFSHAQQGEGIEYILNATEIKISFPEKAFFRSEKLPFKNIIVADFRYDSSKIGYVENGPKGYSKIELQTNWSDIVNNYFKANLDPNSDKTLFVVIKSFWMQKGITEELTSKKVIQKEFMAKKEVAGSCKSVIDVYLADSFLYPLFKIEETFLNFYKFKQNKLDEWLYLPFDSIAKRIISADMNSLLSKKKKLSFEEVNSFYKKRFDIPILKSPLPKKGIFITFEDFCNNKILNTDYRLQRGQLTDELYTVQNGREELLTNFWGITDGETLLVKIGFNIYAAVRQQNTFETFGGKYISNYHNNPQPGDLIRINTMTVDRKILHLNMETGIFY